METKEMTSKRTHHGHAIRKLRLDKKLSQGELGNMVGYGQQRISYYEEKEKIDDELLQRFAKALDVSTDLIKELEDDKPLAYYIQNNTISDNKDNSTNSVGIGATITTTNQTDKALYASLEQMQKLYENSIQLYKQLLESTQEKIANLENELSQLKG